MTNQGPPPGVIPPEGYYWHWGIDQWVPVPTNVPNANNGAGTAALVFGILSLVIPFIGILLAPVALIAGASGVRNANRNGATNKGAAVTGIVCGFITIGLYLAFLVPFIAFMAQST